MPPWKPASSQARSRERQQVQIVRLFQHQRHEADAGDLEPRGPARNDGKAHFRRHQIDDGLLFLGHLRDARPQPGALEQFDGEVVAVRARAAIRHDQRLIGQRFDEVVLPFFGEHLDAATTEPGERG